MTEGERHLQIDKFQRLLCAIEKMEAEGVDNHIIESRKFQFDQMFQDFEDGADMDIPDSWDDIPLQTSLFDSLEA